LRLNYTISVLFGGVGLLVVVRWWWSVVFMFCVGVVFQFFLVVWLIFLFSFSVMLLVSCGFIVVRLWCVYALVFGFVLGGCFLMVVVRMRLVF
jgi:hypothetical protein